MEALLRKQTESLKKLEEASKQDKVVQLGQLYMSRKLDQDEKRDTAEVITTLKGIDKTLKDGFDKSTLAKSISKAVGNMEKLFSKETVGKITSDVVGRRDYRGIGERIRDKVMGKGGDKYDPNSLRYKFTTARGFADTIGLVDKDSTGFFGDMLAKREEKQRYVDDAIRLNPQQKNLKQYGGDESKVREAYANKFDLVQGKEKELRNLERQLEGMKSRGMSEEEIARTTGGKALLKQKAGLATEIGNLDYRYKGLSKAENAEPETTASPKGKLIPFPGKPVDDKEAVLEDQRMMIEQTDLLRKIEENTRISALPEEKKKEEEKGKGFLSQIMDILGAGRGLLGRLAGGAKAAGGAVLGAGKKMLGSLGGPAGKILGPAAAIGAGIYEGYTGWNEADEKVKSGQITEREGTVEKGGAVGGGLGTAGGALAGGKLGAMIGTAILPGVGTAVGGLLGGVLGGLAGGKFGKAVGKMVTDGAMKIKEGVDEYIVKPFSEFFGKIGGLFQEYIVDPLVEFFAPVTNFFKKIKEQVFGFLEDFGIPEISFTIPIIGKKVAIGPFYPFRPEEGTTRLSSNEKLSQTSNNNTDTETYNHNIVSTEKGNTRVLQTGETSSVGPNGEVTYKGSQNFAEFDPKTGKAILENDTGSREISKRAFNQIKSNAREGGSADKIAEIVKEDDAYQKLGFLDKRKVDFGMAKATELVAANPPQSAQTVANASASNDQQRINMAKQAGSSNTVVAPTNISNNTQNQVIRLPARNQDPSVRDFMRSRYA